MEQVVLRPCAAYTDDQARQALEAVLAPLGGLEWVKSGMCIGIKTNLISAMKPEAAATTHPVLLCALVKLLRERGARVTVGDSPGGVYNRVFVEHVYDVCGLKAVEACGGELNRDFSTAEGSLPEGKVLRQLQYTAWLDRCDAVINFCKLKVHAMMGMTAATKNIFGVIPGAVKAEYHYRFPAYEDFADMLVDLNEHFRPVLHLCDAVVGMEGNGPTQGTPRPLGLILGSRSPYHLDLAAANLIGLKKEDVPYLEAAFRRGLMPATAEELILDGELDAYRPGDFQNIASRTGLTTLVSGKGPLRSLARNAARNLLQTSPRLKPELCVGCGVCARSCPAKAISLRDKRAYIDKKSCIRCFCCQELCPRGAMYAHRPFTARLAGKL